MSPVIDAVADDLSGSPILPSGGATPTVFANDTLNGAAFLPAAVIPTIVADGGLTGVTINPDGTLTVPAATPAGVYPVEYRICEVANPANCDTAIASVTVLGPTGSIAGTVFEDDNSDGAFTPGEPLEGGVTVQLLQNGIVIATTTTAADGSYRFDDVPTGTGYTVAAIDPASGAVVAGQGSFSVTPGLSIVDVDLPIDPSGVIYNAMTRAPIAGATVTMTTASGTPLPAICFVAPSQQNQVTGPDGAYRFDIVPNADPACPAVETEYRIAVSAPAGYAAAPSAAIGPQAGALDATTCPGDAVPGGSCQVQAQADAPAGVAPTIYYLAFLLGAGDPHVVHNHIPLDPTGNGEVTLTKTADRRIAQRGDRILYTITATNAAAGAITPVTIVDAAPAGFRYVDGSATVNGAAFAPTTSGQNLNFAGLTLAGSSSITVTLQLEALTSAGPGRHINTATIVDGAGTALAPAATATVEIRALPVLDCSEVIGKVFDDRNRNGYQDENEPGLPSVRLATVKGVLITTDKHGRFHVACADMPDSRTGSNFILKLDARTLPTGYRLTTENPRVVRLTAGKMVKMNFGATIGRVVKLDLNDGAFNGSSNELKAEWSSGIDELLSVLGKEESKLRIAYRAEADEKPVAEKRIAAIVKLVRERWRDVSGRYRLEIETEIVVRK
ncbi:MAG: DUF11 domain-containing protein [Phyllobacteriaceae bacterium]|nr:DUF11 domain-containing protein [Phyllobacteriaceae bacterium]